jgi:hypothetical protein
MEGNEKENPRPTVEETSERSTINMAIFKRESASGTFVYWYNFWHDSKHVQKSAKTTNPRKARQAEAIHRAKLANGETGFRERKAITLAGFLKNDFLPFVESKFKLSKAGQTVPLDGKLRPANFAPCAISRLPVGQARPDAKDHPREG